MPNSYDNLDSTFRQQLMDMVAGSGGRVYLVSGYRSHDEQQALWDEAVAKYGPDEARNWVAPPGNSNHEKGLAADLGGDLDWAHQHAGEFGLSFPMSWENWHIEPAGVREHSTDDAYSRAPTQTGDSTQPAQQSSDPMLILAGMLGMDVSGPNSLFNSVALPATSRSILPPTALAQLSMPTRPVPPPNRSQPQFQISGDDIDRFMGAIRSKESGADYSAVGPPTKWGRATGAYQFLDSTWGYYKGYPRAKDAPPAVQDERARELMGQYFSQFGNWHDVASAWYSGPRGDFASPEVANYSNDVLGRMYG
jgi:hypothetical protein